MMQPNQRSGGMPTVQPNTLSGEAEPNTLSTMRDTTTGRQGTGWTTPARQRAASGGRGTPAARGTTTSRPALPLIRLAGWIFFIIVFLIIIGQSGR